MSTEIIPTDKEKDICVHIKFQPETDIKKNSPCLVGHYLQSESGLVSHTESVNTVISAIHLSQGCLVRVCMCLCINICAWRGGKDVCMCRRMEAEVKIKSSELTECKCESAGVLKKKI